MTNNITAGPELDAAVAAACGMPLMHKSNVKFKGNPLVMMWSPSTDLNAAFEAADGCGLFRFVHHERNPIIFRGSSINPHAWYVSRSEYIDDVIGQGPTLSLAICHAILALHGDK